ncbi:MAG: YbhB/YbcL family Raf kinase inhibitor-like protein [Actinobacteria bacterium]|nr:YbhB/YbcL family Raf kinase inhibitor-like protein [Actinomycetota bacterium]
MASTRILRIILITLISFCFITTFSLMVACRDAAPGEAEEDPGEADRETIKEEVEEQEEEIEESKEEEVVKEMEEDISGALMIGSPAFRENEKIPAKFTCDADNVNPQLDISGVSQEAASLVLIVDDPDAPGGTWVHWTIWNIDPGTTSISENSVPSGAVEGVTDFGIPGYGGPCPPSGTHRYFFKLFAMDTTLDLDSSASAADLEAAIQGHVLDSVELIGLYGG